MRRLVFIFALTACSSPSPFYPCPVDLIVARSGYSLNVDSLRAVHHPDSLSVLAGDTIAVVATDCG